MKVLVDALIQKDIVWTFSVIVSDRWIVSSSSSHACALLLCVKSVCGILQYYVHWPLRITEPISARRQNSKLSQWKLLFSTKINILWVVSTIVRRSEVRTAGGGRSCHKNTSSVLRCPSGGSQLLIFFQLIIQNNRLIFLERIFYIISTL